MSESISTDLVISKPNNKSKTLIEHEIDLLYKGIKFPVIRAALQYSIIRNLITLNDKEFTLSMPEQIKNPENTIRHVIVFLNYAFLNEQPKYPLSPNYLIYINTIWPFYSDIFWFAIFYDIYSLQNLIMDFSKIYNRYPIRYDRRTGTYDGLM
jgi:hypothetical protein